MSKEMVTIKAVIWGEEVFIDVSLNGINKYNGESIKARAINFIKDDITIETIFNEDGEEEK